MGGADSQDVVLDQLYIPKLHLYIERIPVISLL